MSLGTKLEELRRSAGYSQQNVADIIGVERSTYAGYETGKSVPSVSRLEQLAIVYNVDLNAFSVTNLIPLKSKEETNGEASPFHSLSREERVLIAKYRLLKAMGKTEQVNGVLDSLLKDQKDAIELQ